MGNDMLKIEVPGVAAPIEVLLIHGQGEGVLTFHVKRSPIWFTKSEKASLGQDSDSQLCSVLDGLS